MPQNSEAAAFLARVVQLPPGPGVSLDAVLQPSLEDEAELRNLFAQDKANPRLEDPRVGLVDIFDAPADIRVTRARVVQDDHDRSAKYIMPLSEDKRRKEGAPCMVESLEEYKKNWAIFTEGSLSPLINWNNVIAAGGAVQACLSPVPDEFKVSKRAVRKHFHSKAFPTSDVDLFLYGLTPEQAEVKINEIYEAVRDSIPWDVTCIRTKHTVSIHSQYPYRAVQIVLRLYRSPAEILAGFDVDSPCCAYDGDKVWANPRAIVAMMRQCNTVDVNRRSPSYEVRLAKYASRGFEIFVPELDRDNIDPTIFERNIVRIQGLARLLVLERLTTAIDRDEYLRSRRTLRGRPYKPYSWKRYAQKKYKGDLKQDVDAGLELSDYDVVSLHIPYGPGWDARRIEKLIYQTDLGMNSPFNPKNKDRRLHRHPAFFGTMQECMQDCCEHCPDPEGDEEQTTQEEEDKSYIRGRISFIEEDPGRQNISGSFNPIDEGEWGEQAYMGATEKFFSAIAAHDRATVKRMIEEGADVDRRDHVGRTPLQLAIMSRAEEISCDLIDGDARMTSRLVDGRTALHIAAHLGMSTVVRKLLERSAVNAEAAKEAEEEAQRQKEDEGSQVIETDDGQSASGDSDSEMHDSSEDDWDSENGESKGKKAAEEGTGDDKGLNIPEDEEDVPDVFDINIQDWDYGFTALDYAILGGSIPVVELLISASADPNLINTVSWTNDVRYTRPLLLTAAVQDEEAACTIAEKLLAAGAVSSEADDTLLSVFHRIVCSGRAKLVSTLLRTDPNARAVLDVPCVDDWQWAIFPVVSAIIARSCSVLALLLAYGAKLVLSEDDFQRARDMKLRASGCAPSNFRSAAFSPVEVALALQEDVIYLLVPLGAEINATTRDSENHNVEDGRMSYLDFVRTVAMKAGAQCRAEIKPPQPSLFQGAPQVSQSYQVAPQPSIFQAAPQQSYQVTPQPSIFQTAPPISPHIMLGSTSTAPLVVGMGQARAALHFTAPPAWKLEFSSIISKCNLIERRRSTMSSRNSHPYEEIKAYFDAVEPFLVSHGAKTALELSPCDKSEAEIRQKLNDRIYSPHQYLGHDAVRVCQFWRMGRDGGSVGENSTLATTYSVLFAACWDGDNAKIQQLCLPQGHSKTKDEPIQISVIWGDSTWRGITPLHVAFLKRHWDTARLILAIAAAQYSADEPEVQQGFSARNLALDDDSDDEDDASDEDEDMEDYAEQEVVNFIDVAKRPSAVHCKSSPEALLNVSRLCLTEDGNDYKLHTVAAIAIIDDDFEAFIQALDLYRYLEEASNVGLQDASIFATLMSYDRPAMLDEYIRRTGFGIDLSAKSDIQIAEGADNTVADDDEPKQRTYLGLNVHGKKRNDLVRKGDPNAPQTTSENLPMLWRAVQSNLVNTIKYLSSDQPLAAYKFYASSHSTKRAKLLKQIPDLGAVLPARLGTIIHNRKDVIETLSSLRPKEMEGFAHLRHKTLEFNTLVAAARWGVDPWIFDYLLGKKVSPMEVDHRGWNIYHLLCSNDGENYMKLFKHVLHQLPKEVTQHLLSQQTKENRNTPLHMAVKCNRLDYVRLLVETGAAQYLQRDANGCTPLQLAVKFYRPEITRLIAEAGPVEALTLEDGVGNTPLETITRDAFLAQLAIVSGQIPWPHFLAPQFEWTRAPFDIAWKEKELPRLKATIQSLLDEGRLINGTKLTKELLAYADHLENKIAEAKAFEKERKEIEEAEWTKETDSNSTSAVLKVLQEALAARPGPRRLVHLNDVHKSVEKGIERLRQESGNHWQVAMNWKQRRDDEDAEEPEKPPTVSELTMGYIPVITWTDMWYKL